MAKHIDEITSYSAMNNDDEKMVVIAYLRKKYESFEVIPREYIEHETLDRYRKVKLSQFVEKDIFISVVTDMVLDETPVHTPVYRPMTKYRPYLVQINNDGPWMPMGEVAEILDRSRNSLSSVFSVASRKGSNTVTLNNGTTLERRPTDDC